MRNISIGNGVMNVPEIALGCMRIADLSPKEVSNLINTALEEGVNFFDHADIYASGKSEETFSQAIAMQPGLREKLVIQTKCGIRKGCFDFSKQHILEAVDGSLKRLQTDYIDILLLHRPDTLVEPEEVAEAFTILEQSGKVRHFGVSNQNPMQIE
ncbi:MAG TPA: aldo/keto reductase, partial [Firmicutes bacterium]|nr:aldo/keto reductase [Bacillota bacterium]